MAGTGVRIDIRIRNAPVHGREAANQERSFGGHGSRSACVLEPRPIEHHADCTRREVVRGTIG